MKLKKSCFKLCLSFLLFLMIVWFPRNMDQSKIRILKPALTENNLFNTKNWTGSCPLIERQLHTYPLTCPTSACNFFFDCSKWPSGAYVSKKKNSNYFFEFEADLGVAKMAQSLQKMLFRPKNRHFWGIFATPKCNFFNFFFLSTCCPWPKFWRKIM